MSDSDSKKQPTMSKPTTRQQLAFVLRFVAQPLMFFAVGLALLGLLGISQRAGWISMAGTGTLGAAGAQGTSNVDYICPMMCTPPAEGTRPLSGVRDGTCSSKPRKLCRR